MPDFLSQEEIDALLKGEGSGEEQKGGIEGKETSNLDLILDFPLEVSVRLGEGKQYYGSLLDLKLGKIIELDREVQEPVDIYANGKLIAKGEVVVLDEHFGVRITEILDKVERVKQLK